MLARPSPSALEQGEKRSRARGMTPAHIGAMTRSFSLSRLPLLVGLLAAVTAQGCLAADEGDIAGTSEDEVYEHHGLDAYGPVPQNLEDRFLTCPVSDKPKTGTFNGKSYTYKSAAEARYDADGWQDRVASDWSALSRLVPPNMEAVVIDIRRVGGVPHYLYLSNGKQNAVYEPWSSSKFMAISGAMARARTESGGKVGGDGTVGNVSLGDMTTAVHTYAAKGSAPGGGSSGVDGSNGMSNYFFRVAGADYLTDLLHDKWLRLPDRSKFRGGYGAFSFNEGSLNWTSADGRSTTRMGRIENGITGDKTMSAIAQAEWLKRLTQFETDPSTRLPGFDGTIQAEDTRALLYGNLKRNGEIGGMLAGESVYLLQGLLPGVRIGRPDAFGGEPNRASKEILDRVTGGKWRVFHKLGAGVSRTRNVSEIVMATYACLPGYDGGREFVIITSAHASNLSAANTATQTAFNKLVPLLAPGFADGNPGPDANAFPVPRNGRAVATADTALKVENVDSSTLPADGKCALTRGKSLDFTTGTYINAEKTQVRLTVDASSASVRALGCPESVFRNGAVFVYAPHFTFAAR